MFDFKLPEDGSEKRFENRQTLWQKQTQHLPNIRHFGWWFLHNCVAHPIMGLLPFAFAFEFHDWTSRKLNNW